MKRHKFKLTLVMVMIMALSLTLFSVAYAAVYEPDFVGKTVKSISNVWSDDEENESGVQLMSNNLTTDGLPVFDPATLAVYNGKNGQPAYIAFEGLVYEVGKLTSWVGGFHNGYEAGRDLTEAFKNSPHAKSIFDQAALVGTYSNEKVDVKMATNDDKMVIVSTPQSTPQTVSVTSPTQVMGASQSKPNFTAESLAKYNGKNGQPAYIAFEGVVYEVGKFTSWVGGFHNGYEAGKDLTEAFKNSPHAKSIFNNAAVIGTYNLVVADTTTTVDAVSQATQQTETTQATTKATTTNAATTTNTGTQANMTLAQLALYTGQNGQPAYIAVNGVVYDVTSYWRSGQHQGLSAGADMTIAFAGSPHSQSLLNGLPIVGSLPLDQQIIDPNITYKLSDDEDDDDHDEDRDDDHEDDDDDDDEDDDHQKREHDDERDDD